MKSTNNPDDILYELKEWPVHAFIFRAFALGWAVFAVYMYKENQGFFSVTGFLAVLLFLFVPRLFMQLTPAGIKIIYKRFPAFLTTVKFYSYDKIEDVFYEKGKWSFTVFLLGMVTGRSLLRYSGWIPGFINLKIKGKRWKSFEAIGLRIENEKLVAQVQSAIRQAAGQDEEHF